ncbi:MAG: DUF945 family protein [Campylobacterales bacterium]|nr:DUF945 family protein [Campylobacterales bacterium]
MIKKLLLSIFVTLFACATETPATSTPKTPKSVLEKSIEQAKAKGMAVENRKTTDTTDTFDLVVKDFSKLAGMPPQTEGSSLDKNATQPTAKNPYESFNGIAFHTDITYSNESYSSIFYLSNFPTEGMNKDEKALVERIIKNKLLYITSEHNIVTNAFKMDVKDIDEKFETINVKTEGIKAHGTYDLDNLDTQDMKVNIASIMLKPTEKRFLGEYLTIKNIYINLDSTPKDKMLNITYNIGVEMLDANISKKVTKVSKANVEINFANIDRDSYNKLIEISQSNTIIDPSSPELMNILSGLITENIAIEVKDLSVDDLIADSQKMGGFKANAKVTLKKDPNLAQLLKVNPMMALSALQVDAHIELSETMLKTLSQTPKGAMLAFIPPKMEKGVAIYDIKYADNKLLVNGKPLQ